MRTLSIVLALATPFAAEAEDPTLHVSESRECDLHHDGPVLALCGERLVAADAKIHRFLGRNGPGTEECEVSVGCDALFVVVAPEHLKPGPAPRARVKGTPRRSATITLGQRAGTLRVDERQHSLLWSPRAGKAQVLAKVSYANLLWAGDLNGDGFIDLLVYTYFQNDPYGPAATYALLLGDARGQLREALGGSTDPNVPQAER